MKNLEILELSKHLFLYDVNLPFDEQLKKIRIKALNSKCPLRFIQYCIDEKTLIIEHKIIQSLKQPKKD